MWKSIRREGWERIWGPGIYLGHLEEEGEGGGPAENAVTWRFRWENALCLYEAKLILLQVNYDDYKWFYSRWILIIASIHHLDALLFHTRLHFLRCKITLWMQERYTARSVIPLPALRMDACLIINKSCGIIALLLCSCSFHWFEWQIGVNLRTGGLAFGPGSLCWIHAREKSDFHFAFARKTLNCAFLHLITGSSVGWFSFRDLKRDGSILASGCKGSNL